MKGLHVKIRETYKARILDKWEKWKEYRNYGLFTDCILCDRFRDAGSEGYGTPMNCRGCPFNKFTEQDSRMAGCIKWIMTIDPKFDFKRPSEEQFNNFIKKAKKLIIWY